MVSGISNAIEAQPVSQYSGRSAHKPAESQPQPDSGADSVQLSSAAQARLAAQQEAQKPATHAAHKGGHKKEAAEKPAAK
jgi:hypothetical protein